MKTTILNLTSGTLAALAMLAPTVSADVQGVVPTKTTGLVQVLRDAVVEAPYTSNDLRLRMMMEVYTTELVQITRDCVIDSNQYTDRALRMMIALDARGAPESMIARVAADARNQIETCAKNGMRQLNAIGSECYELLELFGEPRWAMHMYDTVMGQCEATILRTSRNNLQRIEMAMDRMF